MPHACYVCNYSPVPDGDGAECPHCHRYQYGNGCPKCGQTAPTIIRGLKVHCSACNAIRGPLAGMPVNVAGKPAKIGSTITKIAGWAALFGSWITAGMLWLVLSWIFGLAGAVTSIIPVAVPGVIAVVGTLVALALLFGARKLRQSGDRAVSDAREQAVLALAINRGGMLTATEVAQSLNIPTNEADQLLTTLARDSSRVGVEVDGFGVVRYIFREAAAQRPVNPAMNAASSFNQQGVRVDVAPGQTATTPQEADRIRENVDREFERMRTMQNTKRNG